MNKIIALFMLIICSIFVLINSDAAIEKKLIIDPGHGGRDAGASYNGVVEAELNLAIALKLKTIFEENGYIVDLTRYDEKDLCAGDFIKKKDMNKRINMINSNNYLACISIHQNIYSDSKYYGAQVFYNDNNQINKKFAQNVQESLKFFLNNTTRQVVKRDNIYLLNRVVIPTIIVECGFITNLEESTLLQDENYQYKLAYCLYYGTIIAFNE